MGGYAAILIRTSDTQDLVTTTSSEVPCGHVAEEGRTLTKTGESYQWKDRTTRLVYSYYDRAAHQWEKGTWSKNDPKCSKEGGSRIPDGRSTIGEL